MAKDSGFHEYVMNEVLREIPGVVSRPMFGDWGIYQGGLFFALIADARLYFKVGETNKADYESAGSEPFVYKGRDGKAMTMAYWELPAEVIDNPTQVRSWVEKSVEVARKAKKR